MSRKVEERTGVTACQTALGWVGIAWTARGLAALALPQPTMGAALGQLPGSQEADLEAPSGVDVVALADKLVRYFEGEAVVFDEPLDAAIGTDFQKRVWTICREIPRSQTRTYGEIAREAGSPGAARAVGQAMARNPWPIVVPCHRVVGSDGSLTGFGGGVAMKRQMLALEGALGGHEI